MRDAKKSEILSRLIAETISQEMVRPLGLLAVNQSYLWTHLGCDAPDADEKVKQALEGIELARENMERMWRNCADLYACIYDQVYPRQEQVDLCALLQLIQEESTSIERAVNVKIETQLPQEPFCVTTDAAMAEQIVLNLLSNALQASKPGGKVILGLRKEKDSAQLLIQDFCGGMTGRIACTLCCGTAMAEEPSWSAGVGLHLCREMCELLEWRPAVKTNSSGTTVTLDIPMEKMALNSKLLFRSARGDEDICRAECLARIRLELSGVPGLEGCWTK